MKLSFTKTGFWYLETGQTTIWGKNLFIGIRWKAKSDGFSCLQLFLRSFTYTYDKNIPF